MKKLLILIFVLVSQISFAQEIIVKGKVVDDYEIPFAGSQVINIRTDEKVITDFDGNYQIIGKIGDTLIFKAYEKVEECFTISKRLVFSKESIEVKLADVEEEDIPLTEEQLELQEADPTIGEYEIVEPIYGDFSIENNSIKFNTSEHAYIDSFISNKHKYALLFIRKYCDDKYYLVFHRDIFRTKNNKWAIKYYNPKRSWYFNGMDSIENKISDIKFKNASVRAKNVDSAKKYLKAPYYKQRGRKFIPLKGFYVDDYFKLWKSSQKEWTYDN